MKKIIKLLAVSIVIATVMLSSTSCGLLTAGIFETLLNDGYNGEDILSPEQEFYLLVSDTKTLLDDVSSTVCNNWYDALYENRFGGSSNEAIEDALESKEEDINTIHQNNDRIIELYQELRDSSSYILYDAQTVIVSYNAYYSATLEITSNTYDFYSSTTQSTRLELSIALKNYNVEL